MTPLLKTASTGVDFTVAKVVFRAVVNVIFNVSMTIQATTATRPSFIKACGDDIARAEAITDCSVDNHRTNEDRTKEDRRSARASSVADDHSPSAVSIAPLHDVVDMYFHS